MKIDEGSGDVRTIALKISNKFAPGRGTTEIHNEVIREKEYVWYGRLENRIAASVFGEVLGNDEPRILFFQSVKGDE